MAARKGTGVAPPLLLYSTNTQLAFAIAQRFYGGVHFVWCCPYFDGADAPREFAIPPTSSPKDLYRSLKEASDRGDQHHERITANRIGLLNGVKAKLAQGSISKSQAKEIRGWIGHAEKKEFSPLLYVIPFEKVAMMVREVEYTKRANVRSCEYVIEDLPRTQFDVCDLG